MQYSKKGFNDEDPPIYFKTTPISSTMSADLDEILLGMAKDLWNQYL